MRFAFALGALLALSTAAQSADTGIEISQACVEVGCFPGDSPGFPVTIITAGSYFLSSDIEVTQSSVTAIVIDQDDVKLNLRGFTIRGPNVCNPDTGTCSPSGGGRGVRLSNFQENSGISLVNGQINGFGNYCATVGRAGYAADLVLSNCFAGIGLGRGAVAERIRAFNNRFGIDILNTAVVRDAFAFDNIENGIQINQGRKSIIENSHISANGNHGVKADSPTLMKNNLISENGAYGIRAAFGVAGSKIEGNVILNNAQAGIFVGDIGSGVLAIEGNTLTGNSTGDAGSQILEGGTDNIIELGLNLCADTTLCL
jgi:hypothetical protein